MPPSGNDNGPQSIALVLTVLAGCTSMDVLTISQNKREPLEGLVHVEGTRATEHPMIDTDIKVIYRIKGRLNSAAVARAIEVSETKYCGVHAMLGHSPHITTRYEIVGESQLVAAPSSVITKF